MDCQRSSVFFFGGACAVIGAMVGCGSAPDGAVGSRSDPIISGNSVTSSLPPQNPGTVAVYHGYVRPCSGTLIRAKWVLTARHCLTSDESVFGQLQAASTISVARAITPGLTPPSYATPAITLIGHPSEDIALVRLSAGLNSGGFLGFLADIPVGLWDGNTNMLPGAFVHAMGYGRSVDGGPMGVENGTSGAGTLRWADLQVFDFNATEYFDKTNDAGQITWRGDSGGPDYLLSDIFGRSLPGVVGVHETSFGPMAPGVVVSATSGSVPAARGWIKRKMFLPGSVLNDGSSAIFLTGGPGWNDIKVSIGNGATSTFRFNFVAPDFAGWARQSGAKLVSGDFDGDGTADIALTGGSGWNSLPVAFSNGWSNLGTFRITNGAASGSAGNFASWAQNSGAKPLAGDFNGDGRTDIALPGGIGWGTVPIALSNGDGTFFPTNGTANTPDGDFSAWAQLAGARPLVGDFDGDGRDDLALTSGTGWGSVPVAFSNGDGNFITRNRTGFIDPNFPVWAQTSGVKPVVGDFNADGRDDIALVGGQGWGSVPVAFSNGDGSFTVHNVWLATFPARATPATRAVTGDFDLDGLDDIAVVGAPGATTIPMALSNGDGSFRFSEAQADTFPTSAQAAGVKIAAGH